MKTHKNIRAIHAGKSKSEKKAYNDFVNSKFLLDKTEDDKPDTQKTDISSVDDDEVLQRKRPPRKKSRMLVIWDFLNQNIVSTIIGGFLLAVVLTASAFYVQINVTESLHSEKISNINKDISGRINDDLKKADETRGLFDIFKAETSKDIEYIKKKLKL